MAIREKQTHLDACKLVQLLSSASMRKVSAWMGSRHSHSRTAAELTKPASASAVACTLLVLSEAYAQNTRPDWMLLDAELALAADLPAAALEALRLLTASTEEHSPVYTVLIAAGIVKEATACVGSVIAAEMAQTLVQATTAVLSPPEPNLFNVCADAVGLRYIVANPQPCIWNPLLRKLKQQHAQQLAVVTETLSLDLLQYIDPAKHGEPHGHAIAAAAIKRHLVHPCIYGVVIEQLRGIHIDKLQQLCAKLFSAIALSH